jgi:hypothetical protein
MLMTLSFWHLIQHSGNLQQSSDKDPESDN